MYSTSSATFVEPSASLPIYSQAVKRVPRLSAARGHTTVDGITYKLADCLEEREEVFRLVHDAYKQSGLTEPNRHGMRVTPYHLLPTTKVVVARHGTRVIATVTLVGDGQLGLPMETTYRREVTERRELGLRLAEPSCLASRQDYFSRTRMRKICVQLFGLAMQTARANGVDRLLAAVHPRHGKVYTHSFGFEQIGGLTTYALVRDNPAVACEHDFAKLDKTRYRCYDQVYCTKFAAWEFRSPPMPPHQRDYFAALTDLRPTEVSCPNS